MPDSATGPTWVLNIRLNSRGSESSPPQTGQTRTSSGLPPFEHVLLAQMVLAEAALALAEALHERVAEALEVARRLPDPRVLDDRRVERDDVVAVGQHRPPPLVLDVVAQQDAVVAVVVGRADAAVDLRRGEDEAAPLAQRDDLVEAHVGLVGGRFFTHLDRAGECTGRRNGLPASSRWHNRPPYADLRIPLRERPHLRGPAVDERGRARHLRGLRRPGAANPQRAGDPLQGLRLLHDRLRPQGRQEAGLRLRLGRLRLGLGLVGLEVVRLRRRLQGQGLELLGLRLVSSGLGSGPRAPSPPASTRASSARPRRAGS